ncbi:MAG: ion channel [Pseudomonadota bacterium]
MTTQILWGSLVLGICAFIHIGLLITAIPVTRFVGTSLSKVHFLFRGSLLIVTVFAFVVFAHTIQVWLWAFCFVMLGALVTVEEAIYFSLVTYTTVGYGDVTVDERFRIFAAMASVTGLLTFGLSTAFLVTFFERVRPIRGHDRKHDHYHDGGHL